MSHPLLYLETVWTKCAQFKSPASLPHFLLLCHGIDIKIIHQRIQTTCLHTSCCHHYKFCHHCNIDVVLFHNATYYTNSLLSCIANIVNIANLLNIKCNLFATCVISWRLKCIILNRGQRRQSSVLGSMWAKRIFINASLFEVCIYIYIYNFTR
jgi:hypothetical protein